MEQKEKAKVKEKNGKQIKDKHKYIEAMREKYGVGQREILKKGNEMEEEEMWKVIDGRRLLGKERGGMDVEWEREGG